MYHPEHIEAMRDAYRWKVVYGSITERFRSRGEAEWCAAKHEGAQVEEIICGIGAAGKMSKQRYAVLVNPVTLDRDGMESGFYKLHIVKVENEQPRNCSHTAWDNTEERIFDDLTFRLYFSWTNGEWHAEMYEYLYDGVGSVDSQRIETLSKGLKKCSKVYSGFPVQPKSFGQFVSLMAAGLGVKEIIRESPSETRRRNSGFSMYSDSTWQVLPLSHAQGIIDNEVEAVREKVLPQVAVAEF